jgi:drug/metabolite transporter (DMT)-like permease
VGKASGLRLVAYLIRSPLWLLGWAAAVGAFAFQAAALKDGQLSVVQALLVTELVFGLVLRTVWIRQTIRPAAWGSAVITCVGLAVFVVLDQPQGGTPTPSAHAWAGALAAFGGAAAVMTLAASWGSPRRRAALYAAAAAIVWALVATFIKTATETLTESGIVAMFSDWPIYALAAGGAAGIILTQAALHVGPLSVSQPLLVIVDPCVSIILSIWLFQERYAAGPAAIVGSVLAFAVMCAGVVALTRTAPQTMRPAVTGSPQD